jgi:hypothetical protein
MEEIDLKSFVRRTGNAGSAASGPATSSGVGVPMDSGMSAVHRSAQRAGFGFDGQALTAPSGAAIAATTTGGELKKAASTTAEKATIEIVALMFQSILAEERIPPAVRVWFARLQLPVLRVALAEPEFFGTLDHPARQLIDRMGSCVMGFDASRHQRQRARDRDQARGAGHRAIPRNRPARVPAGV